MRRAKGMQWLSAETAAWPRDMLVSAPGTGPARATRRAVLLVRTADPRRPPPDRSWHLQRRHPSGLYTWSGDIRPAPQAGPAIALATRLRSGFRQRCLRVRRVSP